MQKKLLYALWMAMYILCVGLGTLISLSTAWEVVLTILSILFFLPGAMLLFRAVRDWDRQELRRIRIISLCSLALTLIFIVLNIVFVAAGDSVGTVLNDLLILFSAPMFCCHWQWISIFLWACLFVGSFPKMWEK